MHVLMISLDATILNEQIGNSRPRHEFYAQQAGRISMVVCNRRSGKRLAAYCSERVTAIPTNSASYFHYLLDGYHAALKLAAESDQPVDVITTQDPFLTALIGLRLRSKLRVPVIMQDHSSFLSSAQFAAERGRNRLLTWVARWILPRADAVRVVNSAERSACVQLGIATEKVCTIPLVFDLSPFLQAQPDQAAAWRTRIGVAADDPLILWVGRPVAFKNLPLLLRAFRRVHQAEPSARLVLAGDLSNTDFPAQIAQLSLTDAVCLLGAVAHHDLPGLYQAASIYALSSNYEGLARVLLEAAASGLPIVSTRIIGIEDVIQQDQTGLLVPLGDEAALADALITLIRNPVQRQQLGSAARAHLLEAFDEQRLLHKWVSMWQRVAKGETACAS
ncbi:MAG: glycosyltransferase family 4 protein [Anaerolineae bacterium]